MAESMGARMLRVVLFWLVLALPAGAETVSVTLGARSYRADLPADPAGAPVILALHGGGGNPAQFARSSRLSGPAVAAGYAVIYPAGSGRTRFLTWNGGYCCGMAAREGVDDLAFLDAVIADAVARFGVNGTRVYVTGMSNGSILAEAYGATRPGKVRAVAGVAGTLDLGAHPPKGAVPILHIHGTADSRVPFQGGPSGDGLTGTSFTPVEKVIAAFAARFSGLLREDRVIDPVQDGTKVLETTWQQGNRPVIRLLKIEGGGHVWPGGRRAKRQPGATGDIDATAEILRFFGENP
jgi:polyhydroxybutyrate depolymerase